MKYETAIKSDKFLVLAHGTADEVAKVKDILQTTRPAEIALHSSLRLPVRDNPALSYKMPRRIRQC